MAEHSSHINSPGTRSEGQIREQKFIKLFDSRFQSVPTPSGFRNQVIIKLEPYLGVVITGEARPRGHGLEVVVGHGGHRLEVVVELQLAGGQLQGDRLEEGRQVQGLGLGQTF